MNLSEKAHARHLVELGFLKEHLEEIGLESTVLERSQELPLNVLLTNIQNDHKGRKRVVNFAFVPMPEGDMDYISLLQFYTVIPCELSPENQGSLEKLIMAINCQTAIGYFGAKENKEVFLRYTYSTSASHLISKDEFKETLFLFVYMMEIYAEIIEDVASGKKSLQEALKAISAE